MAKIEGGFDVLEDSHDSGEYSLLEPGVYQLIVAESKLKETKKGDGTYFSFMLEVVSEKGKGRKVFHNFNWSNPSNKAVEIGRRDLANLHKACGILEYGDTEDLHNIPFSAELGVQAENGGYKASNKIVKFICKEDVIHPAKTVERGDHPSSVKKTSAPWAT